MTEKKSTMRMPSEQQRYLSVNGAASYASLSPTTIRRLLADGRLTALRPTEGRVVIDREEIDRLMHAATSLEGRP